MPFKRLLKGTLMHCVLFFAACVIFCCCVSQKLPRVVKRCNTGQSMHSPTKRPPAAWGAASPSIQCACSGQVWLPTARLGRPKLVWKHLERRMPLNPHIYIPNTEICGAHALGGPERLTALSSRSSALWRGLKDWETADLEHRSFR